MKFKWSFDDLKIPYSIIRIKENKLEVTFFSLDKNNQIKENNVIFIKKQSWIEEYKIKFNNFNSEILWSNDLDLTIQIDWK